MQKASQNATHADAKPYKTDEFGRPADRNYHYRVDINDTRAFRKIRVADKVKGRFIERDAHDVPMGYVSFQTRDNKGPIAGLGEYQDSPEWERPFGPGRHEALEVRRANSGGTKVRGTVPAFNEYGFEYRLPVNFTVDMTLGNLKEKGAYADEFQDALHWAELDAHEERREREEEKRRECDHEHAHYPDRYISEFGGEGYCEDCGAELDADGDRAV